MIGDQSLSSDTSLKVSLTDKQDKRTLSDSGSDTFQVSGAFITDVSSDADVSPQKSITVIYDSV